MDSSYFSTPTISVVIPTYFRTDKLAKCLWSIARFTDPKNISVIVVANGAPENARVVFRQFQEDWKGQCQLLWFDEPLGYPKACNHGIRATDSEFVVLLNDDCELTAQPVNRWIGMLLKPFLEDERAGITGPQRGWDENSAHHFLIFFCVMIRRKIFEDIGLLDESTGMGFGEDTICSIEAERKGWKVLQVPKDDHVNTLAELASDTTIEGWKHTHLWSGDFDIFHDAESTLGNMPESEKHLRRNRAMLRERYGPREVNTPTNGCEKCGELKLDDTCIPCLKRDEDIDIWRALVIDGWFGVGEMAQLARWVKECGSNARVCSIGAWHGRSSRAIADNLCEDAKLFDVDTFNGSSGEPDQHATAKLREGDHAFSWYYCNLHGPIMEGKVIPLRMDSSNAAQTLGYLIGKGELEKFDLIFVDGDHSKTGIQTDVEAWLPLLKEGGLICGHDYYKENEGPWWVHVRQYVEAKFPDVQKVATSLWYARPSNESIKRVVYDAFPLNDELLLLECRLNELDGVVDRWVVTEAPLSHSGNPKPLYFKESIEREPERWAKWLPRITHIIVDDLQLDGLSGSDLHWAIERQQRDAIMRGLTECADTDIIIISDTDEVPRAEAVAGYSPAQGLTALAMTLYYGSMNCQGLEPWTWTRMLTYGQLKTMSPCQVRYNWGFDQPNFNHVIQQAGWHFSFLGSPDEWVKKLENTAHQEYNLPSYKVKSVMLERVRGGHDLLGRDIAYKLVEVDDSFPKFVTDNRQRFVTSQFILEDSPMHAEAYQFVAEVKERFPRQFEDVSVWEVGSLNINGSVRQFFDKGWYYVGQDLQEGDGVDVVGEAHLHEAPDRYDVVISTETLEHDKSWERTLRQMYKNLKPSGILIITCAAPNRPEHGTTRTDTYSSPFTTDYYRNISAEDFIGVLPMDLWADAELRYGRDKEDLYFWGVKPASKFEAIKEKFERLQLDKTPWQEIIDTGKRVAEFTAAPVKQVGDESATERFQRIGLKPVAGDALGTLHKGSLAATDGRDWFEPTLTVTATISTKDRYTTTLPLTIASVLMQTHLPDRLTIYDDGEQLDLREMSPFNGLFHMADDKGVKWEIFKTPREGQVKNHQHALDTAGTDCVWRIDDDEIAEPTCLEGLLAEMHDGVGAVAGLVHHPGSVGPLPPMIDGSLNDIALGMNCQWFEWDGGPRTVEHLYSAFIYRREAGRAAGGYPTNLSTIGHHEESIFTHSMHRAGWKLMVTPRAKTHHLREPTGGIRSTGNDQSMWERDEAVWREYLATWGVVQSDTRLICCDMGLGDHLILKGIWNDIRRRNPDTKYTLALCYPAVFADVTDINIISIAQAKLIVGSEYERFSLYAHLWKTDNKKPLPDAMMEFWG